MNPLLIMLFIPLLGSVLGFIFQTRRQVAVVCTTGLAVLLFFVAILSALLLSKENFFELTIIQAPTFHLAIELLFDHLTVIMLLLITFMSVIIHYFSARYMLSDMAQARFMAQLSLLNFSVLVLVMSGNLFTAFLGWQWIGLSLYLLLNHYHYDLNANKAAKKKFVINRLGDVCFLLAVILAYQIYGTSNFTELFLAKNMVFHWLGYTGSIKAVLISLIFVAIMTKSAQFPFHIWLPDTMETPTPVSAIMHAGIINAGGFLLARLSPLVIQLPLVMNGIFWVGLITLLSGSFFMFTQTDVKKQLAYSTMGQMGFMILQCGLGCFSAAVFHLITHGFFKATLFLNSGNTLISGKNTYKLPSEILTRIKRIFLSITIAILIIALGIQSLSLIHPIFFLNNLLLAFIGITIAQTVWQVLNNRDFAQSKLYMLAFLIIIFLLYLFFIGGFERFLQVHIANVNEMIPAWEYSLVGFLVILQVITWIIPPQQWMKSHFGKKMYVISLNKAYIELFYRRFLLNPMRKIGDIGNDLFNQQPISKIFLAIIVLLLLLMTIYGIDQWWNRHLVFNRLLLIINILLFIVFLMIINRTKLFYRLFIFLVIIELEFVTIGLFANGNMASTSAIFHLINIMLLLFSLFLLLIQCRQQANLITVEQNVLPWLSIYLSIVLLFLIGVPGTASFISEFFILQDLLSMSPLLAIGLAVGVILLAIVVLHLLQLYVFNPAKFSRQNPKLPFLLHLICIISILFNLMNGIFPSEFFNLLNQLKG